MLRRQILLATSLAAAFVTVDALAEGEAIVGIATTTKYSVDARITAADANARTVTLTFANGAVATRKVSPAVANLGATRIGDMVSVAFEEKLTFVLSGPGAKVPKDSRTTMIGAVTDGKSMGGVGANQSVANWWVTAVDPGAGKISVVDPAGGEVRTYTALTAEGRAQLPRVKPGDKLTVVSADILAISITPKA